MQVGKQRGKHALTSRKYILCLMRTFLDTSLRKRDLISDTAVFQGRSQDWSERGGGGYKSCKCRPKRSAGGRLRGILFTKFPCDHVIARAGVGTTPKKPEYATGI